MVLRFPATREFLPATFAAPFPNLKELASRRERNRRKRALAKYLHNALTSVEGQGTLRGTDMDKERRAKSRYEMNLNVRYQTMGLAGPVSGIGKTLNVSSGGVFITGGENVREGTRM